MNALADMPLDGNRRQAVALSDEETADLKKLLGNWEVRQVGHVPQLWRRYRFRNFADALAFTNAIGALAEETDHHPRLVTAWGEVEVAWWTHSIEGLHINDFIMAARCDALYPSGP